MGEQRRRDAAKSAEVRAAEALTRDLMNRGLLVRAGLETYLQVAYPTPLPTDQREELRRAFLAGAHHVFASIVGPGLDPGAEPTEADLARLDKIHAELEAYVEEFVLRYGRPIGRIN